MMTKMEIFNDLPRPKKTTDQKVVKGKRTKRPRPSSSTSSSGGGGGGDQSLTNNSLFTSTNSPSPTSSSTCTITDQEDEDMANCLILLSHGGGGGSAGVGGGGGGIHQSKQDYSKATQRITNKKFAELTMFTATDAKVGIYVYECKTCNRSFPSFQALGGHRASHRKPKQDTINTIDDHLLKSQEPKKSSAISTTYDIPSARDQVFMVVKKSRVDREDKAKVHECSICGSEFASGQALGGHMRRHRSALNNTLGNYHNTTSLDTTSGNHDSTPHDVCDEKPRNNNLLSFDLNLPPALSDDQDGFFLVETTDFLHGGVNGGLQLSA